MKKIIPKESKEYTFTTISNYDSPQDAFLYVIDPRSTEPIAYNDDAGGNNQAKLTKYLEKDISYLIIIRRFNPGSTTEGGITLAIV